MAAISLAASLSHPAALANVDRKVASQTLRVMGTTAADTCVLPGTANNPALSCTPPPASVRLFAGILETGYRRHRR